MTLPKVLVIANDPHFGRSVIAAGSEDMYAKSGRTIERHVPEHPSIEGWFKENELVIIEALHSYECNAKKRALSSLNEITTNKTTSR